MQEFKFEVWYRDHRRRMDNKKIECSHPSQEEVRDNTENNCASWKSN